MALKIHFPGFLALEVSYVCLSVEMRRKCVSGGRVLIANFWKIRVG